MYIWVGNPAALVYSKFLHHSPLRPLRSTIIREWAQNPLTWICFWQTHFFFHSPGGMDGEMRGVRASERFLLDNHFHSLLLLLLLLILLCLLGGLETMDARERILDLDIYNAYAWGKLFFFRLLFSLVYSLPLTREYTAAQRRQSRLRQQP